MAYRQKAPVCMLFNRIPKFNLKDGGTLLSN